MNNSENRCTTISTRGDKEETNKTQAASADPYIGFSSCSHASSTTRNQTMHSVVVGPHCKQNDVSYRRATRQMNVGRRNVSTDNKDNVASTIIGQEQEESDAVLGPPYNSRDDERIEISLNDSGKWPFPFLNEDLCCYYDSMDVTKNDGQEESCELPLGVQEENNRSTGGARPRFLSPYLGITCHSAVSMVSNINSISLFRNIYQLFKQQRNIIMVGCILVIAVFSSTALVDHSRGHKNVTLNVISDINDDDGRAKLIKDVIIDSKVSYKSTFGDEKSPQSLALEWIANVDPMHLLPTDDNLLQRYACAVFYFSLTKQKEIPFEDYYHDRRQNLTTVWLNQEPVCAWSGITCGHGDGNITSFIAETGNVQGPLVREILVALPKLEILQLNNMGLQKELPSEIGLLSNLKVLSLGNNELSGNIPTSLGQLTQLQLLGLQNNLFRNEIPREVWTLKELSAIYLDGNRLTGTIPTEVENLDKLLDFRLRNNRMKGSLPSSLGTLTELRILYLDNNKFNGVVPKEIGRMLELESLTLHENNFVSSLPIDLGNLTNLKHLIVSNNTLSGSIPKNVLSLPKLNYLWSYHNDIVGNISNQICQTMNVDIDIKVDCDFIACECCGQCILDHDENVYVEDLTE